MGYGGIQTRPRKFTKDLQDMIKFRWDEVHGVNGLASVLVGQCHTLAELRLYNEYGDYLAQSLEFLKAETETQDRAVWKQVGMAWQEVAPLIEKEEEEIKNYNAMSGWAQSNLDYPVPLTPVHNQLKEAAAILSERGPEVTQSQLAYEIKSYATRYSLAHNGVQQMIKKCNWDQLAKRTYQDFQVLGTAFPGRPTEQMQMREVIKCVQKRFFDGVYELEGMINHVPSKEALERSRRRMARCQSGDF